MAFRPAVLVLIVVVASSSVSPVFGSLRSAQVTPRMLRPVQKADKIDKMMLGATATDLTNADCKSNLTSCSDCTNVLTCTKLGTVMRPLSIKACPTATPYCVSGECVATLVDEESCNNAPYATDDFVCNGNGYFPSPSDCKKYFMCVDGKPYEYDCSQYTNTAYGHEKAMCVPSTETPKCTTVSCTTAYVGVYQRWSTDPSVYFVCTDTNPANAYVADCGANRQIDTTTGNCELACQQEGRLADPDDNKKYYECIQTGTNVFTKPIPKTCPGTSVFDGESQRCTTTSSTAPSTGR